MIQRRGDMCAGSGGDELTRESAEGFRDSRRRRRIVSLVVMAVTLVGVGFGSLAAGAVSLSIPEVVSVLWAELRPHESDPMHRAVVISIRLPRIFFGAIVGASLAMAGAGLQGIFRNPLADPGLIGVTAGAALGVATVIVIGLGPMSFLGGASVPVAGFLGGAATTVVVYRLATRNGRTDVTTMLLAGIAINAFCGAGLWLLIYLSDDAQLRDFTMWTLGGLGGLGWSELFWATPVALVAMVGLLAGQRALNAMLLGESEAYHLGTDADAVKKRVVFFAALAVGATVGYAGMIGFVGLVVPHLLRLMGGADHRFVLPGSALLGAILLVGADALARTVVSPSEIPIGVLTAMVGAPFFLWLLMRQRR